MCQSADGSFPESEAYDHRSHRHAGRFKHAADHPQPLDRLGVPHREGNAFVWGPLHMLPDDMAALQMLVSLLVVPLANAGGAKHVLLQWLALFMLPIAAGIVENRHDSLTLMYPAIAFS